MIGNVLRQLRGSLSAFVLALLLSFVVWISASLQTDPFVDGRFSGISLALSGQADGTTLLEPVIEQVMVTVRARESVLADLKAASFQASLDLSQASLGEAATIPVRVTCTNPQVRIEGVDPASLEIRLEALQVVTRPVELTIQGQVATGFEVSDPVLMPDQVQVQGPALYLSQVVSVTGSLDVAGARRAVTGTVTLKLLDANGEPVPDVVAIPPDVEAEVPVLSLAQFKPDIVVKAIVRGDPAPGYRKGDVAVEPISVTLEGPSLVLDALPNFVETMPITITGATESLARRGLLSLPADVGVVEVTYVTVTVEILPILGTRTLTGTLELIRVPAGMRASPAAGGVVVTLEGPDAKLAALGPDDILVVLDLRGRARGVHLITPDVLVPEGLRVLTVDPETVAVLVEPIPTPTPTPRP
ncbi:MAG TPA: CdaR family protein [Anaerolineae bacterium]|nr:CdaR family protein [Anaerolineae bacterium]